MTNRNKYIGYRITNKTNNRYYIGVVKAYRWNFKRNSCKDSRGKEIPATPYYLGSGYAIREAIIKHGADAFDREILARFDNLQDADAWERDNVVMQEQDPLSYNIAGGGKLGYKVAKSTREKMSVAGKGNTKTDKIRANMSRAKTGKNNPIFGKFGKDNPKYKHDAPRYPNGKIKWIASDGN